MDRNRFFGNNSKYIYVAAILIILLAIGGIVYYFNFSKVRESLPKSMTGNWSTQAENDT